MPGTTAARPSGLCASRPPFIRVQSSVGALGPKGRAALRYPGGRLTSGPSHRRRDAAVHLQRHCRQCEVSRPSLLREGSHTASPLSARDAASTGLGVSGGAEHTRSDGSLGCTGKIISFRQIQLRQMEKKIMFVFYLAT